MPTLQYAAANRTPTAYGVNLALAEGLAFGAVERGPYVPGLLVTTATDVPFRAELYAYPDLDTPVAEIDTTYPRTWEWLDMLSETGQASITVQNDDPILDLLAYDGTDLFVFYYGPLRAFTMIAEHSETTFVDNSEEAAEQTTISGRGVLAVLEDAVVYPTAGVGRSPIEEDRHFGWASSTFDHGAWATVTVLGTLYNALEVGAVLLAGGLNEDTAGWLENLVNQYQASVPSLYVPLVWAPGGTFLSAPAGQCFFYETFSVATTGDYAVFFVADDAGEFYVDGQQVGSIAGQNFLGVTSAVVTLSAGGHSIAARVENANNGQSINPGKYGWSVAVETQVTTLIENSTNYTVVAQAGGGGKVLAYPADVPGQTVTKTMRIALDEAQARGQLGPLDWDFTDSTFSDGTAAEAVPDIATKVGTSMLAFFQELAETYVDLAMDPASLTLHAWPKGSRGSQRAAEFVDGENLLAYQHQRDHKKVSRMLVRWSGGWTDRTSGSDGTEATLEIGAPSSLGEVVRMADGQFDVFDAPRTEITASLAPVDQADMPYLGFLPGDQVITPDGVEQVKGIGVAISVDEPPAVSVTLRDVILDAEERMARQLRALT